MVEDSADDAELLGLELEQRGLAPAITRVDNGPALSAALGSREWDVVISDHNMPGFSGDDALSLVKRFDPDLPFIVVSGTRGEEHAVEAMRRGANDFVMKSRLQRLAPVVERELAAAALRAEQRRTTAALAESQRQLREAQRLEAVGRLAGGVAHDFNNLMAAVLSYADLILRDLGPDDEHRADVEEIKRAGRRAAELTRQLLTFSRQQIQTRSVLDLNEVLADATGLLHRLIEPSVSLEFALQPDLWQSNGDVMQIEQVLMNLATNARDAMPNGGTLTVTTSNVVVPAGEPDPALPAPGRYVRLEVRDTGMGIPKDIQAKVFDPFFTTKEEGKGTGLGLATVYGIVRQCGGHITVKSEPGLGTAFVIFLPRALEQPQALGA
jgi:signal transduction histidine kinase